jgi:hypothetical protein
MSDSKPRTCVTMLPDKQKPREPILEPEEMKRVILEALRTNFDFVRSSPELTGLCGEYPGDEVGFAFRSVLLSELRTLLRVDERSDEAILEVLDLLTGEKSLKVTSLSITRWIKTGDMLLICCVGGGLRGWRKPYTQPQVYPRFFGDGCDFEKGQKALAVKASVSAVMKQSQENWDKASGRAHLHDFCLESRLHREEVEEQARLRVCILKIAAQASDKTVGENLVRMVNEDDK